MSLSSTYLSRKALIADNLQSMGVLSADADDGLTTLANKILDIEPSISGLDLDTSLTIHSSDTSCLIGQSIMFWAELKADYDDETATDVDLSGVLTGATIEFKNGNTVLGSAVTDSDGIAYYTHTFNTGGIYNITASFAGTDNFDDCVSTSITVSVTYEMSITADKPILSYNDHEEATITAKLSDDTTGISGETLSYEILDKNDNVLDSGSDVTDASGDISFTYQSTGIGDVQVIVYYGMFLIQTCSICDANYYSLPSTDKSNTFTKILVEGGTNPSVSYNTDHYTANYGSKTTMILFPCELPTNCLISVKLKRSTDKYMGLGISKGTGYANVFLMGGNKLYEHHYSNSSYGGSGGNVNCSYTSGYNEFVIEKTGQIAEVKINGTTYMTKTLQFSASDTLYAGIALDNASVCDFKEILIKPL